MWSLTWGCFIVLGVAAGVTGERYRVFRPQGYNSLPRLGFGRGPDPLNLVVQLTQVQAESDLCEGLNDILTVTLPAPIVGDISPKQFTLLDCPVNPDDYYSYDYDWGEYSGCYHISPACARMQLEGEPGQRRTLLLFGQFIHYEDQKVTQAAVQVDINHITFMLDGKQLANYGQYASGWGFGRWMGSSDQRKPFLGYGEGPFLADTAFVNLSAPLNTAAADPDGCAARHPSATYAVRLLFASAVHERAADGGLAPFGTNATAAAALFSVHTGLFAHTASPDRVVGVAHAPGGSAVDVCIEAAAGEPQVDAVFINGTEIAPLSAAGYACRSLIKAYLRSVGDQFEGRDRASFAGGHTIDFCISSPEDCPAYVPEPPDYSDYSDYSYDGGGGDYDDDGDGGNTPDGQSATGLGRFVAGAGVVVAAILVMVGLGLAG